MLTGVERLDVVQLSHWKVAEITGEAKRKVSVALLRGRKGGRESTIVELVYSMHDNECMCLACMHVV